MIAIFYLIYLAVVVAWIAGMWKAFEKAGQPGWTAIIPFLNIYVLVVKIAKRDLTWAILCMICGILLVVPLLEVAEKFGKSQAYGIGLWILGFVFWPMLGFGPDEYQDTPEAPVF
jgi:uncharacterized membrane protein YhaH (DUF805 family)